MSNLLETAISKSGGVGKLADSLGIRQNVVSNWRARGLPKPWAVVLELKFLEKNKDIPSAKRSSVAIKTPANETA